MTICQNAESVCRGADSLRPLGKRRAQPDCAPTSRWQRREGLLQLDDHFDLDDRAQWQRRDADRSPRVFAAVAEYGDEQIRAAVDDLRLPLEIIDRVNKTTDADDAFHFRELANFLFECGQQGQRG